MIRIVKFFLFFLCITFNKNYASNESVYELGDKLLPYSESAFFKNQNELSSVIKEHNIHSIIEIGSWFGESTIFMASQLPKDGIVYAIDSWIGYPKETYEITLNVYLRFLSNVIHAGMTDRIIPIRMTSLSANKTFPRQQKVDLVYIDADHAYKSVYSDLKAWRPLVRKNGVLCGNLYAKTQEESNQIKKAVSDYCKNQNLSVKFKDYFWRINL